jgi:hypothetical protein
MNTSGIYRLWPIARPYDQNWDHATNQGEAIVRAHSSGDARVVASEAEAMASGIDHPKATTKLLASAFRDPKLYAVQRIYDAPFPGAGPRMLLQGELHSTLTRAREGTDL